MEPGTQVGAYRLVQPIGEGGMGIVWLAEHAMLGRRAAIKLLHPMFTARPDIVTRFFNEARAATAISDPGIVQIFDFGQHVDGTAYIAMEMLEGEPLDKRLARLRRLPLADALRIMRQVASTLGVAHARGIVHRDLKPENIYLVRDPEVIGGERAKVLDFGIAKLTNDPQSKTNTSAVMGTPTYMSPEQCRGAGRVDQRSDVYALGCMVFTLCTGTPPFDGDGGGEIIAMHLREPAPAPSSRVRGLPRELDALVLRCLAKDPAQRFASGTELAAALGALAAATTVGVVTTTIPPSATQPARARAVAANAVTTLSSSSGSFPIAARPSSRRILGVAAVVLVISGGITALVMSRGAQIAPAAGSSTASDATVHVLAPPPAGSTVHVEAPPMPPPPAKPAAPEAKPAAPEAAKPAAAEAAKPAAAEAAKPAAPEAAKPAAAELAKPVVPKPEPAKSIKRPRPAPPVQGAGDDDIPRTRK